MKLTRIDIHPQFVMNNQGKKIGVFLDIPEYEGLLEKLEDLYLGALAVSIKQKESQSRSLDDIKKELGIKSKPGKKVKRA